MSLTIVCHAPDCPRNGQAMTLQDATHGHWVFRCAVCENWRTVDKTRAGGTLGAGRRDDQPALKYSGRGW